MLWYIFSQFSMVLGYLQRVVTHCLNIFRKSKYEYLKKNDGKALQIEKDHAYLRENVR